MNKFIKGIVLATILLAYQCRAEEIIVKRGPSTEGKLTCTAAGVTNAPCYWKKDKRIPAGTYPGCSTTFMEKKGHKAVFIPDVQDSRASSFILAVDLKHRMVA